MEDIKKKKNFWKWLLTGGLVFFLVSASVAPYLLYRNQDLITEKIVQKLNESQVGHTTIEEIYISPFRNFPYISVDLRNLKFYASNDETQRPVYAFKDVYVGFDAWQLLRGEYTFKKITVEKGEIHIVRYADSTINLILAKELNPKALEKEINEAEQNEENDFHLDLESIELYDILIDKEDSVENTFISLELQKAKSEFVYNTDSIDSSFDIDLKFIESNIQQTEFLKNKSLQIFLSTHYNIQSNYLDIDPSELLLEGGIFSMEGRVDFKNDNFFDLVVNGKKPDFKLLTSFAPPDIYEKLESYRNEGEVYFKGIIQGKASDDMPSIVIEFGCKNADFINPKAGKSIKDLNFKGFYTNGEKRNLQTSELYIQNLKGKPEGSFVEGSFHVKNFKDPYFSIDLHSNLDLSSVDEFIEIDELQNLRGKAVIDITIDELLDADDMESVLGKLKDGSDSRIILEGVSFEMPQVYPYPIKKLDAKVSFAGGKLQIDYLSLAIEDSKMELTGTLDGLTALLHQKPTQLDAKLKGNAPKLNLPILLAFDSALAQSTSEVITNLAFETRFSTHTDYFQESVGIPQGEFWIDSLFFDLKNYAHTFHDFHIDLLIEEKQMRLKRFHGEIDKSSFDFDAYLNNYKALFSKQGDQPIDFYIDLTSDKLIFNDLLTYGGINYLPEEYRAETVEDFELEGIIKMNSQDARSQNWFENTDIKVTDLHGKFQQHRLKFRDISGHLSFRDKKIEMKEVRARLGKSDIKVSGELYNFLDSTKALSGKVNLFSQKLDIDEIITYEEPKIAKTQQAKNQTSYHDSVFNIFSVDFPDLSLNAQIKDLTYHKYHFRNLSSKMRSTNEQFLYVDELKFDAADGQMDIKGYFDGSDSSRIYFKSKLKVENADLDKLFFKFDNFGQDFILQENIHGRVSGIVDSKVRMHADLTPYLEETEAHADITITNGSLVNFPPFEILADYMEGKDLKNVRFAKLTNTFDIKNGSMSIPRMEIGSTIGYMYISGKQDIDLKMDYVLELPIRTVRKAMWQALFNKNAEAGQSLTTIENVNSVFNYLIINILDYFHKVFLSKKAQKGYF